MVSDQRKNNLANRARALVGVLDAQEIHPDLTANFVRNSMPCHVAQLLDLNDALGVEQLLQLLESARHRHTCQAVMKKWMRYDRMQNPCIVLPLERMEPLACHLYFVQVFGLDVAGESKKGAVTAYTAPCEYH